MSSMTERIPARFDSAGEIDGLADTLIRSLDLARSVRMPLLERLLEMSLVELGQIVAAEQKSGRDRLQVDASG